MRDFYYEDELVPNIPHLTVVEELEGPYFTGLLDNNGKPIYVETLRNRIGFDLS